jgi:methylmalonyl-CoA mutase C-terminal domain/subunit
MKKACPRILLAKMGLDSHDTGIVIVAELLRNAGYEVIYLGLHNDAKAVVRAAIQEDADAIGVSFLSGQHMTQMRLLLEAVRREEVAIPVFCGGVIPRDDAAELRAQGVAEVFFPGTPGPSIIERIGHVIKATETA